MDKISAARAMEWSIELDKGLRSRKPGAGVEAVRKIGPRLEEWGREPEYTMATYSMFGLVPGEDRLFASAILLRLVEAFRVGEREVRQAVVELFLSEFKGRAKRKNREGRCGIFRKCTEENCLEMMRRVKVVFDKAGYVALRADCLVLFGCWADFAGENADVRHLILMSLASVHDMEAKAALFAAGCFCEKSDDFAYVVLHILTNIATSGKTSCAVRLTAIRIFGKMQSSFTIIQRAYKAALMLVHGSTNEDVLVVSLRILSKLASKSTFLVSEQVNLLCSVLNQETTLRPKATVIRSLNFYHSSGCYSYVSVQLLESLLSLLVHPQVPDNLQFEALKILQKILFRSSTSASWMEMVDSSKLHETLRSISQSQSSINRVLAVEIMSRTASKLKSQIEVESSKFSLVSYVISLITERMTILSFRGLDHNSQTDSECDQEGLSLSKILIRLAKKHPDHCMLVVDKFCFIIERLKYDNETDMDTSQPGLPIHAIDVSEVNKIKEVRPKPLQLICRVLSVCLEVLIEIGAFDIEMIDKVISAVRRVCEISYSSCSSMLNFLPLHPYISWTIWLDKINCQIDKKAIWDQYLSEFEILALNCAQSMLNAGAYWPAYRYGVRAACHGVYIVHIFICEHLMTKLQTEINFCWMKSLVEFALSEWESEQLFLPKPNSSLEKWLKANNAVTVHPWHNMEHVTKDAFLQTDISGYSRKLLHVHLNICSARKTLHMSMASYEGFYFQKWFLALKANLIEAVLELLKIVGSDPTSQKSAGHKEQVEHNLVKCTRVSGEYVSWSASVSHLCSRLKRLALEFDFMLTSFVDLDMRSLGIISALALSSSLLAFSSLYVLRFPDDLPLWNDCSVRMGSLTKSSLVHNLVYRLSDVDEEITKNIGLLLKIVGIPIGCFHLPSRTQKLTSFKTELIQVCNHAITGFTSLQNDINNVSQNDNPSKIAKIRVELMFDIIMRWLAIPSRIPRSFFHCRPPMGCEIFVMNADPRKQDCLSTTMGCCLAVNLCIQLKNIPPKFSPRINTMFCVLQCGPSLRVPKSNHHVGARTQSALPPWEADYLIDLNQKLLHHVTECNVAQNSCEEISDKGSVYAFVQFETNEKYQGFSTSVLDVSGFPIGSYETRWLSCYVDDLDSYWSLLPLNPGPVITIHNP